MTIKLLDGTFSKQDAIDLLVRMVHVKIKFQEGKIQASSNEEDIKTRENRIKALQNDLMAARQKIEANGPVVDLHAVVEL